MSIYFNLNTHQPDEPNFITYVKSFFDRVILFTEDEEYLLYFKDATTTADFDLLSIRSLSLSKQEKLIRLWVTIGEDLTKQNEHYDKIIDDLEEKVDNIILKSQIVPRYPFYILSIIQAFETFMPNDYRITAYGHCYQAIITAQIIKKNIEITSIPDCFNYLTQLAYFIFSSNDENPDKCSIKEYEKFVEYYKDKFIIKDSLLNKIEVTDYPIIRKNSFVKFEHPYLFYYFVGKFIAENSDDKLISKLCSFIYLKSYSNILIFTIHHTHNLKLLDEILLHCMCSYDKYKSTKLTTEETNFMGELLTSLPKSILSEDSVEENRKKEREISDTKPSENSAEHKTDDSIAEINKAIKIIEVLGQILKNRAGSFEKAKIIELLEQVEELGFRVLSYFLNTLKSPSLKEWLVKRLEIEEKEKMKDKRNRYLKPEFKRLFIERNIQVIALMVTLGIITKIYHSVQTDKLCEIQKLLQDKYNTPNYEMINLLFILSYKEINIDEFKHLIRKYNDTKNIWALKTLSLFLQSYMNTHHLDYKLKQQICVLLEIEYKQGKC